MDETGKVLNRYGYDAWGVSVVCEEQVENRFRYTGEQFDAITRQYYLRARFYNPVVARFTQEDTYRGDGLNLYAYCANNPVGYVDPSGHQPQCVKDAAAKYMADGLGKEEAYRKAYQNHVKQKLANAASLPVQELIKLEERARRLGLKVDSSVNRKKNPEAKTPDAEQRDGRESKRGTPSIIEIVDKEKRTFKIKDWSNYPDDYVPLPNKYKVWTFLEGDEYNVARDAANTFNRNMRSGDSYYAINGLEIHEIEPVKMGGSPTDPSNKTAIQSQVHRRYVTPWWNKIRDEVKKGLN